MSPNTRSARRLWEAWAVAILAVGSAIVYGASTWGGWISDLWTLAVAGSAFLAGRASRG